MHLTIDTNGRRPIYRQIADGIRALIASGQLAEGQALPPTRQMAADLGVNLNTIAAAYRELQDDGLIAVKHGSGARVASRTAAPKSDSDLRQPLRSALTELILSGLRQREILSVVHAELRGLRKAAKP